MKKAMIPVVLLSVSLVVAGLVYAGEREAPAKAKSIRAVIVPVNDVAFAIDGSGVTKSESLSIHDEALLAKLESYFPSYQTKPKSDYAVLSEGQYQVYIDRSDGSTYPIMLSFSGHWSMGHGSLKTRGDANAFVAELYGKFEKPKE